MVKPALRSFSQLILIRCLGTLFMCLPGHTFAAAVPTDTEQEASLGADAPWKLTPWNDVGRGSDKLGDKSLGGRTLRLAPEFRAPSDTATRIRPVSHAALSLVISGGVSLGAYEAGFLYYLLEVIKQYPEMVQVKGAAGASAGSLNALLSLMSYCQNSADAPEDSLFWQTWVPLGFDKLGHLPEDSPLGLFNREWMLHTSDKIEAVWKKGLKASCDMVWGVAVTRLTPRTVSLADARLELPHIEEKFTFRIRGHGPNKMPELFNYTDVNATLEQTRLVEDETGRIRFADMRDLTLASCSFPLAFSPMPLDYCVSAGQGAQTPLCLKTKATRSLFIDGGVLDNSPLRLMARAVLGGLAQKDDDSTVWRPTLNLEASAFPSRARFMFVSPDATDYPLYGAGGHEQMPKTALGMLKQLATTFISTSRTKELYTLLEERPELRDRIYVPRRHHPTASGLLSSFFGFFERDFRVFDFYLGMLDARQSFDEELRPMMRKAMPNAMMEPVYPEEEGMFRQATLAQWLPMQCLRASFDGIAPLQSACDGEAMHNFRILMQVSTTRLYDNCARLDAQALQKTRNPMCLAGARGEAPPRVEGVFWPKKLNWRHQANESELEYLLRLLAAHRFIFVDMGLTINQGTQALAQIRQRLGAAASSLAAKQPLSERGLLQLSGEFAADYVAYSPPPHLMYFTVARSLELGYSHALTLLPRQLSVLRLDATFLLDGAFSFITAVPGRLSFGPSLGLELTPHRFGSRMVQWRAALRAGYMFAAGDRFSNRGCDVVKEHNFGDCSRVRTEFLVGLTAFEHVRLQLGAEYYPPSRPHEQSLWSVSPGIGLQF